jgi:hypothetical protein
MGGNRWYNRRPVVIGTDVGFAAQVTGPEEQTRKTKGAIVSPGAMRRSISPTWILLSSIFAVLGTCAPAPALTIRNTAAKASPGVPAAGGISISLWSFFHSWAPPQGDAPQALPFGEEKFKGALWDDVNGRNAGAVDDRPGPRDLPGPNKAPPGTTDDSFGSGSGAGGHSRGGSSGPVLELTISPSRKILGPDATGRVSSCGPPVLARSLKSKVFRPPRECV